MKDLKKFGQKVQKGLNKITTEATEVVLDTGEYIESSLGVSKQQKTEAALEEAIGDLLNFDFKSTLTPKETGVYTGLSLKPTNSKKKCIELIKDIKKLAIEAELNPEYHQAKRAGNRLANEQGASRKAKKEAAEVIESIEEKHKEIRQWADGDAEKIYKVLKKHAIKNTDGKIKFTNLEDLKSDGLVWDFLEMILEEITKFFGKKIDDKTVSAGDKYTAGKFAGKVVNTKGDKSPGK
jgi:hypothetical protein